MKRLFGLLGLIACITTVHAQTLDDAIKNAAQELSGRLQSGSTIAVVSFKSDSPRLTDYVIDELNGSVISIGALQSVERRRIDAIRDELDFNISGEVSDESAQSIGRMLGAQSIVMGSIEIIGRIYRIRFQAISTETATFQHSFSENIKNDRVLETLLAGTKTLVDFTFGQRMAASALNVAFGAGSFFIQGDKVGGGWTAGLEGLGAFLFIGASIYYSAADKEYGWTMNDSGAAYPFYIGLVTYAGGAIFGIIRAQVFHKPGSQIVHTPLDGLNIGLVSTGNNRADFRNAGLRFSYTWKY